jgi:IS4 transposase
MIMREMLARLEQRAPMAVMVRALLENVFAADRLNKWFDRVSPSQENKTLMFSSIAEIMGLVALRIQPSVHAAYQAKQAEIAVTAKAIYDKLQRIAPCVSQALLRDTAARLGEIVGKLSPSLEAPLPGFRVKILDGNHLARTQRRLQELRSLNGAPLPGHCLVVLDPQWRLITDVFPCEDGHASERSLLGAVAETIAPKHVWIADRNFCTCDFLQSIQERKAFFIIRQHGNLQVKPIGKRKLVGRTATGAVFEQAARLTFGDGSSMLLRRVSVELDEPTRDGDRQIHILTNLPKRITALRVAELYRQRWTIETAFQEVAANLDGEIQTLGYPRAALFAFCMALVSFNLVSVLLTAIRAAHAESAESQSVSIYYTCDEIAHMYRGLTLVLNDNDWTEQYASLSATAMARKLIAIAKGINLRRYRKHPRGPKKPPPKMKKRKRNHVSTARILAENRNYEIKGLS